jgi:hydroxyethylthiazole kinase-like sugar kinase family protein
MVHTTDFQDILLTLGATILMANTEREYNELLKTYKPETEAVLNDLEQYRSKCC